MNRTWITWLGLAAVALAAAVLSFASLRTLAVVCGTPLELGWLLPVCIDAAALVATRVWLTGSVEDRARSFARTLALGMILLSVAGNGVGHFLAAYSIRPMWWAVVAVASVPPAVLGAVAHLAALGATKRPAAEPVQPEPVPVRDDPTAEPTEPADRSDDELLMQVRAMAVATGQTPSLTAVRTGLRVGTGRARRLLGQVRSEGNGPGSRAGN